MPETEHHEVGGGGSKFKAFVKKPIVWIGIGVIALIFILRARASSGGRSPAASSAAPSFGGGGGGFGGGGSQEGGGISSGIRDQLDELDLKQGLQELKNRQALFDFGLKEKEGQASMLHPLQQAWADTQEALQKGILSQVQHTKAQCAHGDAKIDPETGQLYCRTPEGGGFKPFQQVGEIISGNLTGVKNVFAGIWQGAAAAAPGITQAYLGQVTGFPSSGGGGYQRQGKQDKGTARTEQGMNPQPSGMTGSPFNISGGGFPGSFPGLS